jgi:hypothetical protein
MFPEGGKSRDGTMMTGFIKLFIFSGSGKICATVAESIQ